MKKCTETRDEIISLHDCRTNHMEYKNGVLSFDFPEGFFVLNDSEATFRCGKSKMECHIVTEDKDDIKVYIYKKTMFGTIIREDWSDKFISAINNRTYEFEFVSTYRGYQSALYKGYVWFDKKPYHMECDIELYTDHNNVNRIKMENAINGKV